MSKIASLDDYLKDCAAKGEKPNPVLSASWRIHDENVKWRAEQEAKAKVKK